MQSLGYTLNKPPCRMDYSMVMLGLFLLGVTMVFLLFPDCALAQGAGAQQPARSCTSDPQFQINMPAAGTGIISIIVQNISAIINNLAFQLYQSILSKPSFQISVRAALTIFVAVSGILFTFGLTQVTLMDFLVRVVKVAIVALMISPNSWNFFYNWVGSFFNDGTNWFINVMSQIAVGTVPGINVNQPFAVIDNAIATVTSSRMFVTLIATFFTGPYGLIFGILILMGLGSFIAALFQAMWVYLVALVMRAFLFALAPIFFAFLLFQRTRHLFDGWVNALVSSSLQPIFLFTFFAFFAKLIEAALWKLLQTPVCMTPPGSVWAGTPYEVTIWRFMIPVGGTWQMYGGGWSFTGAAVNGVPPCPAGQVIPAGAGCIPVFPISIMDVLIFLLLVQLAFRFNGIVVNIAKDISGASLSLNISGAISEWLNPARGRMDSLRNAAQTATRGVRQMGAQGFNNRGFAQGSADIVRQIGQQVARNRGAPRNP